VVNHYQYPFLYSRKLHAFDSVFIKPDAHKINPSADEFSPVPKAVYPSLPPENDNIHPRMD
jgi:hypothetical protein